MKFERRRSNVNVGPNKPLSILDDNTTNEYQGEDEDGENDENNEIIHDNHVDQQNSPHDVSAEN